MLFLMWTMTSCSKHFMIIGVRATGRKSFMLFAAALFGTGMMVEVLRHTGTTAWESEMLKMSVQTSVSSYAQPLSTFPGILSGPVALRGFMRCSDLLTSSSDTLRGRCPGGTVSLELGEVLAA